MIVHYVNLIGWSEIFEGGELSLRHVYRCDSVSLKLAVALISGKWVKRSAGTRSVDAIRANLNDPRALFLVSENLGLDKSLASQYVLPFADRFDSIPAKLGEKLGSKNYRVVFLGISSPKQNQLAGLIGEVLPSATIFCAGAAVPLAVRGEPVRLRLHEVFGRLGLEFLVFAFSNPSRGYDKLRATFIEIKRLIFDRELRRQFREFSMELVKE